MVRVAIAGAAGRMGLSIVEALNERHEELKITAATVLADDPHLGLDVGVLATGVANGVEAVSDVESASDFDVMIDFTAPEATLEHIDFCQEHGKAMVIGTTGFAAEQKQVIFAAGESIPIVFAPNMSIGVNLCFRLLEEATKVLGDQVDIEILEAHHRDKKDAPSGTALKMGETIANVLGRDLKEIAIYGREGTSAKRDRNAIGFSTIRAGDIVGDHTVIFAGLGESIEITHRATGRMTFANGAVRAAQWVFGKENGVYSMGEVLGL